MSKQSYTFNIRTVSKKTIILGLLLGIVSGYVFGTFLFQRATSGVLFGIAMIVAFTIMFDSYEKNKK